jgi:hypothetical protein
MKLLHLVTKSIFVVLFIITNVFGTRANVNLIGFKTASQHYSNGYLNIPVLSAKTSLDVNIQLSRNFLTSPAGTWEDGNSTVTLVYSNCGECGTYTNISTTRQVTSKDFLQPNTSFPSGYANFIITGEVPANISSGFIMAKLTKYDYNNKKTVTEYVSTNRINIRYTPPTSPITDIFDLVTFPARRQSEAKIQYDGGVYEYESRPFGVKLPEEKLEIKWNASKLPSSTVNITLYQGGDDKFTMSHMISKKTVDNTGGYSFDFTSLNVNFYGSLYFLVIEDLQGRKIGKSCMFRFINDHVGLFDSYYPNAFTNSAWIFRPDSSGSGYDGSHLNVDWFANQINAANVVIDIYNPDGTFLKRLSESTPNNGHFTSGDTSIPRGFGMFYQYKVTSKENPSQYGYSEVFNNWYD